MHYMHVHAPSDFELINSYTLCHHHLPEPVHVPLDAAYKKIAQSI